MDTAQGECGPRDSGSPQETGEPAGGLQDPRLSIKEPVLAARQALTQVQWRVPQPISLVGVSSVVQKQLHWKQESPRGAIGGFYWQHPSPTATRNTESQYTALCSFTPLLTREVCLQDAEHHELRLLGGSLSLCRY